MFDWVGWLLRAVYIYGFLIGVSNFEIDWRAGRVLKSIRSTAYAATVNILTVIVLGFQVGTDTSLNVIFGNANKLHEYVIIVMSVLRIISGLTLLLTRWQKRCKLMKLVRILFRLYLEKPQIKRMSRWAILTKTITVTLKDFLQIALALEALGRLGGRQALGMYMQFGMAALMSYALSQHYLIMLFVRVEYQILNSELERVIEESCWLSYRSPRNGVFMTKCCYLADQLEDIGKRQDEVQSIVTYLGEVFAVQGLLAFTENYISSVGTTYLIFSLFKYGRERLGMSLNAVIFSTFWCFFHYLDSFRSHFLMLSILDEHRRMADLLKKSSMFAPGLDVRLEQSFETYLFQLARNPLKMHVMQMFPISHTFTTAMFASIAMNSIYLIQYDIENF